MGKKVFSVFNKGKVCLSSGANPDKEGSFLVAFHCEFLKNSLNKVRTRVEDFSSSVRGLVSSSSFHFQGSAKH